MKRKSKSKSKTKAERFTDTEPRFKRVIDTLLEAGHDRHAFNDVVKSLLEVVDWTVLDHRQIREVFVALFAIDDRGYWPSGTPEDAANHEKLRSELAHRALFEHSLKCSCCAREMERVASPLRRAA